MRLAIKSGKRPTRRQASSRNDIFSSDFFCCIQLHLLFSLHSALGTHWIQVQMFINQNLNVCVCVCVHIALKQAADWNSPGKKKRSTDNN